jgi:hypothetical protein
VPSRLVAIAPEAYRSFDDLATSVWGRHMIAAAIRAPLSRRGFTVSESDSRCSQPLPQANGAGQG